MTGVRVALNYSYKTVSSRKTIPPPHPAAVGCVRAYLCVESMHATRHRYECESESHGDQRRMCKKKLHTRRTVGKEIGDRRARRSEGRVHCTARRVKDPQWAIRCEWKNPRIHTHTPAKICAAGKQKCSLPMARHSKRKKEKQYQTETNLHQHRWKMDGMGGRAGQGIVAISASVQWLWTSHRFSSLFRSAHALSLSMALFFYANACYTLYIWSNIVFPSGLYHFK